MNRYASIAALLTLLALVWAISTLSNKNPLHLTLTSTHPQQNLAVTVIQTVTGGQELCEQQLDTMRQAMNAACRECLITHSSCSKNLSAKQTGWLQHESTAVPTIQLTLGVIAYHGESAQAASEACKLTAAQLSEQTQARQCYLAHEKRPQNSSGSQQVSSDLAMFVPAIPLVIALISLGIARFPNIRPLALKLLTASTDFLVLSIALTLIHLGAPLSEYFFLIHSILIALSIFSYWVFKEHYGTRSPFWDELQDIFKLNTVILLLAGSLLLHTWSPHTFRDVSLIWISAYLLIPLGRSCVRDLLTKLGLWQIPTLIIGTGDNAKEAYQAIQTEKNLGYAVIAFAHESTAPLTKEITISGKNFPVIPLETALDQQLKTLGKPQIIIALESLLTPENQQLVQKLSLTQSNIHIIPSLRGLPLFGTKLTHFFSHEVLFMTVRNNLARRSYQWLKRSFDLCASLSLLLILSPLFIFLILEIRKSGGPAFFGHTRVGQNGKLFKCLKFRSMRPDAEKILKELLDKDPTARAEWEKDFKLKNDPRITPIGNFLRKTSLDELPQLINVIKGEMSLVGPRPVIQTELDRYGESACFYLEAKPGVTGLWQVSGRNDTTYAERVSLDSWYVQNWSLWYDIAILFKTFGVVFGRKGAY